MADEKNSKTSDPGPLVFVRQIGFYARPYWLKTALCLLAATIRAAFMLALPLFYKEIFDGVLAAKDSDLLVRLLALMAVGFAVAVVADLLQAWLSSELAARVMADLRGRMYTHLQQLSEAFYARTQIGDLMSRFTNDLFSIDWAVSVSLVQTYFYMLMSLASTALLFYFDWRLALITVVVLPLTFIGPKLMSGRVLRSSGERKGEEAEVAKVLQEDLAGHQVIQAFGLQRFFLDRFFNRLHRLYNSGRRANLDGAYLAKASDVGVIVVQLVIVAIGAFLALDGQLSGGDLVGFLTVLFTVGNSIKMLTQLVPDLLDGAVSMRRVNEIFAEQAEGEDLEGGELAPLSQEIRFEGVDFSYSGQELNLADLNFSVRAGQSVAFVGRSGSGKSTVLNLLTRFYQESGGRITLDGRDLRTVSRSALRAQIGAVFQNTYLFNTTIRENIRQGRLDASDEEVEAAAKAAEIHQFIIDQPDGYDSTVGEGGGQLSGGQRQRIALARAILRDPAILVLDEATSALDPSTEAAVNATLEKLAADRTMLSVTHRLTSVTNLDCIFVLDKGKLVEEGRHKELLNLKGIYYEMWQEFALELTGDALMGEKIEAESALQQPTLAGEPDDELAELDRLMGTDTDELSQLIQQFEGEAAGEDREAQQLRETNQRWAQLVGTDRLTGLPNKMSFLEALVPVEIQQAQRAGDPIGFVMMSPDNFGVINEQHGRNAGDAIIAELARLLEEITKGEELLGHLDGSNFAVVFYPATGDQARARAGELQTQVAAHEFIYEGVQIQLTLSAGAASLDSAALGDPREAAEDISTRLNDALYRAKKAGGNCVEMVE